MWKLPQKLFSFLLKQHVKIPTQTKRNFLNRKGNQEVSLADLFNKGHAS